MLLLLSTHNFLILNIKIYFVLWLYQRLFYSIFSDLNDDKVFWARLGTESNWTKAGYNKVLINMKTKHVCQRKKKWKKRHHIFQLLQSGVQLFCCEQNQPRDFGEIWWRFWWYVILYIRINQYHILSIWDQHRYHHQTCRSVSHLRECELSFGYFYLIDSPVV